MLIGACDPVVCPDFCFLIPISGLQGSIFMHYDIKTGPPNRTGTPSADCQSIAWNDSSVWTCRTCGGNKIIDVHIIAHTHGADNFCLFPFFLCLFGASFGFEPQQKAKATLTK